MLCSVLDARGVCASGELVTTPAMLNPGGGVGLRCADVCTAHTPRPGRRLPSQGSSGPLVAQHQPASHAETSFLVNVGTELAEAPPSPL